MSEIALGGTAVGTGINTPEGYSETVAKVHCGIYRNAIPYC